MSIFEVDVMFAGEHHASMKMQRAERPKATIEARRRALGRRIESEKVVFKADSQTDTAKHNINQSYKELDHAYTHLQD